MQGDNNQYGEKLKQISLQLPDFCAPLFLGEENDMAESTRYAYATELKWFFKFLIDESPTFKNIYTIKEISINDVSKITPRDVQDYLEINKEKGKSYNTIARRRAAISKCFSYMFNKNIIDLNPVEKTPVFKAPKKEDVIYIDIVEQNKLLAAVKSGATLDKRKQTYHDRYKKRDIALISLLLDTGSKISWIHNMNIKDIDFNNCSILVIRNGGKRQCVYFSDEVKHLLLDYLEERKLLGIYNSDYEPVFVTLKGERLSIRAIQKLVEKYTDTTFTQKGERVTPHKLRSSFAMEFYESTKDIKTLQKKLGHNNISTTSIYTKATDEKLRQTRNVLENKRADLGGETMRTQDALIDAMKVLIGSGVLTIEEAACKLGIEADELKRYL